MTNSNLNEEKQKWRSGMKRGHISALTVHDLCLSLSEILTQMHTNINVFVRLGVSLPLFSHLQSMLRA